MQENVSILKVLACGAIGTASNARFIKVKVKVRIFRRTRQICRFFASNFLGWQEQKKVANPSAALFPTK